MNLRKKQNKNKKYRKILEKNITPPSIPFKYLSGYPAVANMIETIEFSGNYSVTVKLKIIREQMRYLKDI